MARTWPGTICHLQAVPYKDILLLPPVDPFTQTIKTDIKLKPGKRWNIVKLISQNNAFSEQNSYNSGGIKWDQQIKGYLYGQSPFNHLQVNNWTQYRWIILAREVGSQMCYLVGNQFRGAQLSVIYDNSSTTLTTLQFDFQSISRTKLYEGTLITPNVIPSFSPGSPVQFLVGDANTIPANGTTYTKAALIGKSVIVIVDGQFVPLSPVSNQLSCSFNMITGTVTFSSPPFSGQLIQIFY